jgi:hypothetical protein
MNDTASSLLEYLYLDEQRLDTYFHQISDPISYDKVPVWKVGLSAQGPIAEGQQARLGRPYTAHEKLTIIMEYLRKKNLVFEHQMLDEWTRRQDERVFCIDTLSATRILIPTKTYDDMQLSGFGLWVSSREINQENAEGEKTDPSRSRRHLYIIEDAQVDDKSKARRLSGYSALHLLVDQLEKTRRELFLGLTNDSENNKATERLVHRFSRDPIDFLRSLGGTVLTERNVTFLYRLRASCNDENSPNKGNLTIIGYAIAAWAGSNDFSTKPFGSVKQDKRKWWQLYQ